MQFDEGQLKRLEAVGWRLAGVVPRCNACKWWGEHGGTEDEKRCMHRKLAPIQSESISDGACDDEQYGGIITGPDFGCIHWESESRRPLDAETA